ncbi:hypothetical protein PILCRDRAFT_10264 [Piloderma croceum F 1598]|uniref:Protein kinase domain-containing protein n=1 Tax=Piloderma croceum (strain F 1598) TaxID=765440 RepID=A0A0C3AZJ9_PILCF|nr:hypothetical protein PILCRDRAFT_10264 [Piloderma croceum F 1598]
MEEAFGYWPSNSVGDVMDMLLQALEALACIYASNIAHRDAFHNNFLVQWHPESMRTMSIPASRPRVYLIDFEVAMEFPAECPPVERMSTGYPPGGSFPETEMYSRPLLPEISSSNNCYCPFKLDIWQLGSTFANFRTTIAVIDAVIDELTCSDLAS